MPRFMLDTDTCSFILKRSNEVVPRRLQAVPINDVCISVITKTELLLGVELSPRRHQDSTAVDAFLLHVAVFSLPDEAALHYATFSSSRFQTVSTLIPRGSVRSRTSVRNRPGSGLRRSGYGPGPLPRSTNPYRAGDREHGEARIAALPQYRPPGFVR